MVPLIRSVAVLGWFSILGCNSPLRHCKTDSDCAIGQFCSREYLFCVLPDPADAGREAAGSDGGTLADGGEGSTPQYTLTVLLGGNGSGTVLVTSGVLACGASACAGVFDRGQVVTLTARAGSNMTFTGWSGGCSGVEDCVIEMTADAIVGANFSAIPRELSISVVGPGRVTSSPAGIECGANCLASFDHGTQVTVMAEPGAGARLVSWGGACAGNGACGVTMTAPQNVTATFDAPLTVTISGNGQGTVTSTPAGLDCSSGSCAVRFGSPVTLVASAEANSTFTGWTGACVGTGACSVAMQGASVVTANFSDFEWSSWAAPPVDTRVSRFVIDADSIADSLTGLKWQRLVSMEFHNWNAAKDYCKGLELAGASDWRLPTVIEITSIVDYSRIWPAFNIDIFPDQFPSSRSYWTATAYPRNGPMYAMELSAGIGTIAPRFINDALHVRCVR